MFRAERAEIVLHPRVVGEDALRTTSLDGGPASVMVPVLFSSDDPIVRRIRNEPHAFFFSPTPFEPGRASLRQAMVAPLRGESEVIGSLLVGNRLTEGTVFDDDDLRLLETLANQAAVALENGQLEQSLAELSRLKEQLRYQAYHDPLTGLANRSLFVEQVDERIQARGRSRRPVVLFIDLDDFKVVNDTLGHVAGDRLLIAVADRVRGCVRSSDLAARLGGDEFAILLEDGADLAESIAVCRRILEALQAPLQIDGQEIGIAASIGVAAARLESERADELLRNADVAMYTAKAAGKNRYAVFESTMHAALVERHALASELSRSIGRGELLAHFQPIVALATGATYGVEALVRWRHPTRGILRPDEFIRLAEENGTILALGSMDAPGELPRGRVLASRPADRADRVVGEPVGGAAPATDVRRGPRVDPRRDRLPRRRPDPRADRVGDVPRHPHDDRASPGPPGAGDPDRDRRLRHRLLVAGLPPSVPGGHPEDRP